MDWRIDKPRPPSRGRRHFEGLRLEGLRRRRRVRYPASPRLRGRTANAPGPRNPTRCRRRRPLPCQQHSRRRVRSGAMAFSSLTRDTYRVSASTCAQREPAARAVPFCGLFVAPASEPRESPRCGHSQLDTGTKGRTDFGKPWAVEYTSADIRHERIIFSRYGQMGDFSQLQLLFVGGSQS